jgi:hypothetical protein
MFASRAARASACLPAPQNVHGYHPSYTDFYVAKQGGAAEADMKRRQEELMAYAAKGAAAKAAAAGAAGAAGAPAAAPAAAAAAPAAAAPAAAAPAAAPAAEAAPAEAAA